MEGSAQFVVVWDRGNNLGFVGVESTLTGHAGAEVLGQDLVKAEL